MAAKTVKKPVAKSASKSTIAKKTAMPAVGSLAPDFSLPDINGKTVTLSKLRGKKVVIYFYPKDDTPGCTIEAIGFRDTIALFEKKGVKVYGISKDDAKSHRAFTSKFSLNFPLLSDTSGKTIQAYGAWVEKNMYGKKYMGIQRSTFLIGEKGKILQVWSKVTPEGHSKEILKLI